MRAVTRSVRRLLSLFAAAILAAALLTVGGLGQAAPAQALSASDFDPGNLISDSVFTNTASMSVSQVQTFLEEKGKACTTTAGYTCLKDYRQDTTTPADANQHCAPYPAAKNESAAAIIVKVGKACNVNPQVILVTLQKEQGLITVANPSPSPKTIANPSMGRYQIAMGYGCPDGAACNTQYYGFFNQVFKAARQFDVYRTNPNVFNFASGRTSNILYHPAKKDQTTGKYVNACGSSPVHIENWATAALYNYTPYQPNKAALANLHGTGDSCSSYGNRNFWVFFNEWFGSTQVQETVVTVTVKDASGQPMAGVAVAFYSAGTTTATVSKPAATQTTGDDGTAQVTLQRGTYKAAFVAPGTAKIQGPPGVSDPPYMTTWAGDTTSALHSDVITAGTVAQKALPVTIATWHAPAKSPFRDVTPSTQFYSQITWLYSTGISTGYANDEYKPGSAVNRNAMAAFLYRLAGSPAYTAPKTSPFSDVPTNDQYYREISWLASKGISTGYSDGTFRPGSAVKRNAMAAFLYRLAGSPASTTPQTPPFSDVPTANQFAREIDWLSSTGVSTGYAGGTFKPASPVNRNAMAAFLYRMKGLGIAIG